MTKAKSPRVRPIQPRHIPAPIREVLAMWEALRRLGFPAADIFCAYYPNQITVVLKMQGKEFTILCGKPNMSQEQFAKQWTHAAALWNGTEPGMTDTTRAIIYQECELMKGGHIGLQLIGALKVKGIECPFVNMAEALAGQAPGSFAMGVNSKGGMA
ncbi:MAG: hypothetical protein WC683_02900 [bacterium]